MTDERRDRLETALREALPAVAGERGRRFASTHAKYLAVTLAADPGLWPDPATVAAGEALARLPSGWLLERIGNEWLVFSPDGRDGDAAAAIDAALANTAVAAATRRTGE